MPLSSLRPASRASIALSFFLAFACVKAAAQDPHTDKSQKDFLDGCRNKFAQVDAAVSKAGAGFAGYHRIRGYPYLRSDRMLASFGDKVSSFEAFDAWTWELRENDGFARNIELSNMGMPDVERANLLTDLRLCAVWLSNDELMDGETLHKVYQEAQPPNRVTPASHKQMVSLEREVSLQQAAIKADFADSAARDPAGVRWRAKRVTHSSEPPALVTDPLGRIGYTSTDWKEMAEKYAPTLLIETAGSFDSIGAPTWSTAGEATVDPDIHQVYYMPSYARVQGQTLVQIIYFVWFTQRTSDSNKQDPAAGRMDGLIWRVTFDPSGTPLLFDSMHMSGLDQMWFIPSSVTQRELPGTDDDPVLIAQKVTAGSDLTVRIHSGSHSPWRVLAGATSDPIPSKAENEYELIQYDDLMTLPFGEGRTRSFFDSRGIVPGTERMLSIQTAGIPYAGAMRQWGNQPTSVTGRHFFDDPRLIDRLFIVPIAKSQSPKSPADLAQAPTSYHPQN